MVIGLPETYNGFRRNYSDHPAYLKRAVGYYSSWMTSGGGGDNHNPMDVNPVFHGNAGIASKVLPVPAHSWNPAVDIDTVCADKAAIGSIDHEIEAKIPPGRIVMYARVRVTKALFGSAAEVVNGLVSQGCFWPIS